MDRYRVVILAAGAGSRLGTKAAKSHKALIRVGEKAVISHIIDIFPKETTFVVAVGHNAHLIQEYLDVVHADRTFLYVMSEFGTGYGPGYSLGKCRDLLQQPFFYFDCDTIIQDFEIDINGNWVACAEIPRGEASRYCTVAADAETGRVTGFMNKDPSGTSLAWVGAAFVRDFAQFWPALAGESTLVQGERQVVPALFSLPNLKVKRVKWHDTGNDTGLAKAREAFHTVGNLGRDDEEIFFHNGYVVKYFEDGRKREKIADRMTALRNVSPEIMKTSAHFLKYRYTPGTDLSRIDNLGEHILRFLTFCETMLWREVPLDSGSRAFKDRCLRFYRDKTTDRVKAALANLMFTDRELTINGQKVPALGELLQNRIDWDWISDGIPSIFHGDLNLSNVIRTPQGEFVLVDCREDFGGDTDIGDRYYDLAKIYQSLIWPHQSVRQRAFRVAQTSADEFDISIDMPSGVENAREIFNGWAQNRGYDLDKIHLLSSMTLVNIAALHEPAMAKHLLLYGWHCIWGLLDSYSRWIAASFWEQ